MSNHPGHNLPRDTKPGDEQDRQRERQQSHPDDKAPNEPTAPKPNKD
jgi:hypothetical protein